MELSIHPAVPGFASGLEEQLPLLQDASLGLGIVLQHCSADLHDL